MNSASLCSLAGRYDNPIPTRCLALIDFFKIPALVRSLYIILISKAFWTDRQVLEFIDVRFRLIFAKTGSINSGKGLNI
jgi:hypothetical protein